MEYTYDHPRPAVTVDAVVFREIESVEHVLLIQRKREPFAGLWAIPGGFMDMDETLEAAAARELLEETGLHARSLKQVHSFSAVDRDPRGRTISVAFLVTVEPGEQPRAADDARQASWFPLETLPPLAFDHADIIQMAYQLKK
jgi:8-oxo-dGTP diphosphatase